MIHTLPHRDYLLSFLIRSTCFNRASSFFSFAAGGVRSWFLTYVARQLERNRIVVLLFEVFSDSAEVEQEEMLLLVLGIAHLECIASRASPLDLDVLGRR